MDERASAWICLEKSDDELEPDEPLAVARPAHVWFEAGGALHRADGSLSWSEAIGYPAACWKLQSAGKNPLARGEGGRLLGSLRMWWTEESGGVESRTLRSGEDYQELDELPGKSLQVGGVRVAVTRCEVALQRLPNREGQPTWQPCLTLELQHEPHRLVKSKLLGLEPEGERHHYFSDIGRYRAEYWPITTDQLRETVSGVDFVAIDQLKQAAENSGRFAEITELGGPGSGQGPMPIEANLYSKR